MLIVGEAVATTTASNGRDIETTATSAIDGPTNIKTDGTKPNSTWAEAKLDSVVPVMLERMQSVAQAYGEEHCVRLLVQ
jgi:hypothetical protein